MIRKLGYITMIIPMVCFSCGKQMSHLWEPYQKYIYDHSTAAKGAETRPVVVLRDLAVETVQERAFRVLGVRRECCKRTLFCAVDLSDVIQ
jgi:DNA-directed RNA polymerase subunit N (RpoN/RPB10)